MLTMAVMLYGLVHSGIDSSVAWMKGEFSTESYTLYAQVFDHLGNKSLRHMRWVIME